MARLVFYDSYLSTTGNVINGATVEVFVSSSGLPATIYQEDGTTLLSASGTFLTGYSKSEGEILFSADSDVYDIKITNGAEVDWIYRQSLYSNVSRHVMRTGVKTANYYAKIKTWTVSTSSINLSTDRLYISSLGALPPATAEISVRLRTLATGAIDTANSSVSVLSLSGGSFAYNQFFLVQPAVGTVELWIQAVTTTGIVDVHELASDSSVVASSYNNGATWQAGAPTTIITTSDWVNVSSYVPTVTPSSGTLTSYTVNTADYQIISGMAFVSLAITITNAGTATGTCLITLPKAIRSGFGIGQAFGRAEVVGGEMLQGRVVGSSLSVWHYDNTTPFVTGAVLNLVVIYPV